MTVTSEKGIIEDGMNIMALECQSILSGENQREIFYRIFGCFVQNANFDNKADIKQVFDLVNASTGNDKKYNLRKMEDCAEFFSTCKNRELL